MKTAKLFTSLINLNSDIHQFEIEEGFYLTSSVKLKNTIIEKTLPAIGGLEYQSILKNKVLAFANIEDNVTDKNKFDLLHDFYFLLIIL
ncbi:MAG: hypothetical protein KGV59_02855 [Tenacibaculum sp.]|nr:hypothetical protein [Tenacibaculum sp.]